MARNSWKLIPLLPLLGISAAIHAQDQPPPPDGSTELVIVPKNGQTREQQWSDRYACHDWARHQSGFDPTAPGTGVPASEMASRREQYRRARIACLEGRGYAVHEGTAAQLPPASARAARAHPRYVVPRSRRLLELRYHPLTFQFEGGWTITQGSAGRALDNGWNAGLGLTWTPTSTLPLSFRVDGSYSRFRQSDASLRLASQSTGANITYGDEKLYGGDVDARFDLRIGPRVKEYFFGGVGWYRMQTEFMQRRFERGLLCFFYCVPGYIPVDFTVSRSTSGWLHSWNAGMGFEFALEDPASFFIEARYMRLSPSGSRNEFVPISVGLRF